MLRRTDVASSAVTEFIRVQTAHRILESAKNLRHGLRSVQLQRHILNVLWINLSLEARLADCQSGGFTDAARGVVAELRVDFYEKWRVYHERVSIGGQALHEVATCAILKDLIDSREELPLRAVIDDRVSELAALRQVCGRRMEVELAGVVERLRKDGRFPSRRLQLHLIAVGPRVLDDHFEELEVVFLRVAGVVGFRDKRKCFLVPVDDAARPHVQPPGFVLVLAEDPAVKIGVVAVAEVDVDVAIILRDAKPCPSVDLLGAGAALVLEHWVRLVLKLATHVVLLAPVAVAEGKLTTR